MIQRSVILNALGLILFRLGVVLAVISGGIGVLVLFAQEGVLGVLLLVAAVAVFFLGAALRWVFRGYD